MITKKLNETIKALDKKDKEFIFQELWDDLNKDLEVEISSEHEKILLERYKSFKNGSNKISDWSDVKNRITSYDL